MASAISLEGNPWIAPDLLPHEFYRLIEGQSLGVYYRGIQLKRRDQLDLAYHQREGTYHGKDHISNSWTVAANHAFHFGEGSFSILMRFHIPNFAVKPDGRRGPRSGYVVDTISLKLPNLTPLVTAIGFVRKTLPPVDKLTPEESASYQLWRNELAGKELLQAIVRDVGPTSSLITWLPEADC